LRFGLLPLLCFVLGRPRGRWEKLREARRRRARHRQTMIDLPRAPPANHHLSYCIQRVTACMWAATAMARDTREGVHATTRQRTKSALLVARRCRCIKSCRGSLNNDKKGLGVQGRYLAVSGCECCSEEYRGWMSLE
jgi:hypothetical protein